MQHSKPNDKIILYIEDTAFWNIIANILQKCWKPNSSIIKEMLNSKPKVLTPS